MVLLAQEGSLMKIVIMAGMAVLLSSLMPNAAMANENQDSSEYEQTKASTTTQLKVLKVREAKTEFLALAIDSKTGAFYTRMGYGFEGPEVQMYKIGAAF